MKRRAGIAAAVVLAISACNEKANEQQSSNTAPLENTAARNEAPAVPPPPATGPDAKTPLAEPKGPIDPKSAEAAAQIVQQYGALIEQHRTKESQALWGSNDSASDFAVQLRRYPEVHLEIGKPGDMEGAAGSSYVTVTVTFYGKDENGAGFRRAAEVVLRRVNDVPGSTAAQRRWHIERIQWKDAA
jgi:hypothetical protein